MDCIDMDLACDRWRPVVSAGINVWVPHSAGNFWKGTCWFLRKTLLRGINYNASYSRSSEISQILL